LRLALISIPCAKRAMVKIPPEYTDLRESLNVTPAAVEAAFIKANPNLSTEAMAIECDKKRLTGVRIFRRAR
jgi:ribonuclease T2